MIGIIGGYGNIGIEAADIIKTNSSEMIRVAGRNISKVSQRAKELFASDKWFQIKESSSNEWKDFIKGCRLVLCSAELGNETVECINRIAGELDCPIVYLGINLPKQEAEGKFIYGAGSIPGLSGIIPQYLAQDFDSVASIDFYYGAKGTFTYTAAKDYMDGVFNNSNRSMVMWKYGKLLPYVPAEVEKTNMYICNEIENMRCFPYFDDESEYLCQKYGLSEGRWHMCISGENTLKVLERARYDYQVNKDKTLRNICRASKLDCFGTTGITKFVYEVCSSNEVNDSWKNIDVESSTYVIYTSGSTGKPKGVEIAYKSMVNTVLDINDRIGLNSSDTILGLSSLCFDLSVYDLFATFFTGAQLKLVKELRDTEDIKKLVDSSSDIVWNSVPAAMELFIDSLDEDYKNDEMKAVLLSGDWINVNLPDKIKKHFPKAAIFSLGGATEASIWSIYYPIKKVDASWTKK